MSEKTSRTHDLDWEIAKGLGDAILTRDDEAFGELAESLPEALTRKEIDDIGLGVRLPPRNLSSGERVELERDVIFHLGSHCLTTGDLVTLKSVIESLQRKGIMGVVGSLILRYELRSARKDLVYQIILESREDE